MFRNLYNGYVSSHCIESSNDTFSDHKLLDYSPSSAIQTCLRTSTDKKHGVVISVDRGSLAKRVAEGTIASCIHPSAFKFDFTQTTNLNFGF